MKRLVILVLGIFMLLVFLPACQRKAYQFYGKTSKRKAKKKWAHYNSLQYK